MACKESAPTYKFNYKTEKDFIKTTPQPPDINNTSPNANPIAAIGRLATSKDASLIGRIVRGLPVPMKQTEHDRWGKTYQIETSDTLSISLTRLQANKAAWQMTVHGDDTPESYLPSDFQSLCLKEFDVSLGLREQSYIWFAESSSSNGTLAIIHWTGPTSWSLTITTPSFNEHAIQRRTGLEDTPNEDCDYAISNKFAQLGLPNYLSKLSALSLRNR